MSADAKRLAESLVETAHDALMAVDAEGRILLWNWASEVVFGFPRPEAMGRRWVQLLVPEDRREEAEAAMREAAETGSAVYESLRRRRDGEAVSAEVFVRSFPGEDGRPWFAVSHRDVTDAKRMAAQIYESNRDLDDARAAAEAATRAKSDFLAMMSHEIRTPMNAVIGMTSLLSQTQLTAEQREFVDTVRASGEHLLVIINDILDFSKIESGRMELEQHPFEVRACVEESLDLLAARAAEKGLELAYILGDEVPAHLAGDAGRLRQVLVNLLSNAVKFTERGEVLVTVNSAPVPDGRHEVHFAVRDTGIGIPKDRLDRLFKPFSQADASTTRNYGGTGLGLAITKRLAEMMGGRVWVESEPGSGSTFHVAIAAEAVVAPVRVSVRGPSPQLAGRRVLVVDDNATNRRILTLYAQSWGMQPREASGPGEALEMVRRGDPFDLVVVDYLMPVMDGVALAAEIRRMRGSAAPPLVMLSSVGMRRDDPRVVGARFAAVLTKPLKQSQIYNALLEALAEHGLPAARTIVTPTQSAPPGAQAMRILLAEDNAVNQKVALRMLQRLGYRADVAANGIEAIDALARQRYDVVFMDVQMPEMDGLEAARRICQRWRKDTRPYIIAMTANALQGDREACLQAGMDDYISKPVDLPQLAAALGRTPAAKVEPRPDRREP